MTMNPSAAPIDRGPQIDLKGYAIGACFIGDIALMASAEGEVVAVSRSVGEEGRDRVHDGGILFAIPRRGDGGLITAGDDGRVRRITLDMAEDVLLTKGKWPGALAAGPDGAVAVSVGRMALIARPGKDDVSFEAPSMIGGLAFAPKGVRVIASHYNGATAWWPGQPAAAPLTLEWKGSHLDVMFSPDGTFVVTSMQENALHGWRLADKQHMRMSGYPGKTRSMCWDAKGNWLATSGADCAILWPFQTKDGPIGKPPREMAIRGDCQVSKVAFHPKVDVLAVGYSDGMVLLTRLSDTAEILAIHPQGSPVSLLHWSPDGKLLAWGCENGQAGLFPAAQG